MDDKLNWLKENNIIPQLQTLIQYSQYNKRKLILLKAMYEESKRELIKYRLKLPYCYQLWLLCGNGDL